MPPYMPQNNLLIFSISSIFFLSMNGAFYSRSFYDNYICPFFKTFGVIKISFYTACLGSDKLFGDLIFLKEIVLRQTLVQIHKLFRLQSHRILKNLKTTNNYDFFRHSLDCNRKTINFHLKYFFFNLRPLLQHA